MAAIKIIRKNNKERKDGTAPLALRISKDYKTSYIFLDIVVEEKHWDVKLGLVKRTHPQAIKLNNFLRKKLVEANGTLLDDGGIVSSKRLKRQINGSAGNKSFYEIAAERIEMKYMTGTYSVAKAELSILHNI